MTDALQQPTPRKRRWPKFAIVFGIVGVLGYWLSLGIIDVRMQAKVMRDL